MVVTLCEVKPSDILQNIPFASLVGSYIFRTHEPRGKSVSRRLEQRHPQWDFINQRCTKNQDFKDTSYKFIPTPRPRPSGYPSEFFKKILFLFKQSVEENYSFEHIMLSSFKKLKHWVHQFGHQAW